MKKMMFILLIFIFYPPIFSNTTRDIGSEPELNLKLVSKWILFYTNIERVRNNLAPLQYDADLEKAAFWQAEYCSRIQKLDHTSQVNGMNTIKDRIEHFNQGCGVCGENLTVKFAMNSEGVRFYIKNDAVGTYYDFGNYTVKWRNEQEMGYSMLESWMNSPGHRKNILNGSFVWMGPGATKGIYSKNISYYGCQVFNGYGGLQYSPIKSEYELNGFQVKKGLISGKDAYMFSYNGSMMPGVIEVNKDKELKTYPIEKKDDRLVFIKSAPVSGELYFALYDKKQDKLYPVMMLR